MFRKSILALVLAAGALLAMPLASANAGVYVGIGVPVFRPYHRHYYYGPYYYGPRVIVAPAPVVVPAPVYVQPPPTVYVQPAPQVIQVPAVPAPYPGR